MVKVQLDDMVAIYDSQYFIKTSLLAAFSCKVQITSYAVLVVNIVILVRILDEIYFYLMCVSQQF